MADGARRRSVQSLGSSGDAPAALSRLASGSVRALFRGACRLDRWVCRLESVAVGIDREKFVSNY